MSNRRTPRALVGGHRPFDSAAIYLAPAPSTPPARNQPSLLTVPAGNLLMTFLLAPVLAGAVILTGRRLRLAPLGTAPELAQRWV